MIYNTKCDIWEWMTSATFKEQYEYFRETQNAIFDELDDTYERKYGKPYFHEYHS